VAAGHLPVPGTALAGAAFSQIWRPTELASVDAEIEKNSDAFSLNLIHPRRKVVGVSAGAAWPQQQRHPCGHSEMWPRGTPRMLQQSKAACLPCPALAGAAFS